MTLSRLQCASLIGLDALPVEVEVDVSQTFDKISLVIVGLPDTAVRESKDRVLTAIKNGGFRLKDFHCTVNLAPGDLKKEGVLYDLPIAVGLMHSAGLLQSALNLHDFLIIGELALSGELRPLSGALAIAQLAKELGKKGVLLPAVNAEEAALLPDLAIYPMRNLKEVAQFLCQPQSFKPLSHKPLHLHQRTNLNAIDFADIKGQAHAKRALEIAAAGSHNLLLSGPPGCGKTLMAKALPSIMPELLLEEALEVTRIHSIAGILPPGQTLMMQRPFRAPHHTISYAGLVGGGTHPRPGEVSLAHHDILFLDELPEFARSVLEVLRQPLEDRKVTISRAQGNYTFPTSLLCVAAMNPCPCGYLGHPDKPCKDTPLQIERYRSKISGPLLDRLDMYIEVPPLRYGELAQQAAGETSAAIRERVVQARERQCKRQGNKANAQLNAAETKRYCTLDAASWNSLQVAIDQMGLSARACERILRVARTIADLEGADSITENHLLEALNLRNLHALKL